MRFTFSLFGHEIVTFDFLRAVFMQADDEDGPDGIGSGAGGQFEQPAFGFQAARWFPGEDGEEKF